MAGALFKGVSHSERHSSATLKNAIQERYGKRPDSKLNALFLLRIQGAQSAQFFSNANLQTTLYRMVEALAL